MNEGYRTFWEWVFSGRRKILERIARGEEVDRNEFFLAFTRHNPTVISYGSAGLNGSVKGIGFVPKKEFLEEYLKAFMEHISSYEKSPSDYSERGVELLLSTIYSDESKIEDKKLISLELAKKHTWTNFRENPVFTLSFFHPPVIHFEVRGKVEIHEPPSILWKYANAQHDVYHYSNTPWEKRPAYLFIIEEVYDNSATPKGFGRKIL